MQETLLRAWRSFGDFEGRASLRTWLYRIATNACLRALEDRGRRPLPSGLGAPGEDAQDPVAAGQGEVHWLEPIPDALVRPDSADPAAIAVSRASLRLALIAALQYLPARQRAVLILRDVLRWQASEVADLLGTTTTAVNGLLLRARAVLERVAPAQDDLREPKRRSMLDRYAAAFENADASGLSQLLRRDAVFEMPPIPTWFVGREPITQFLRTRVLRRPGDFTMLAIAANGQPGFAGYLRGPDGRYHAHAVQVLTLRAEGIAHVVSFNQPELFAAFGVPPTLSTATGMAGPSR